SGLAPEPLVRVGPDGEVRSVDPGYDELRDLLPQRQPSQRRLGPRLGSVGPGRLAGACRALRTPHEREEREEAEDGSRSREKGSDRKSTRLNSSHVKISYAVFCLKKKKRRRAL